MGIENSFVSFVSFVVKKVFAVQSFLLLGILPTGSWRQEGAQNTVRGDAISDGIPKAHTGGLILYLLPVAGEYEERCQQRDPHSNHDIEPGTETPGGIILDYVYRHTIDPTQQNAKKNTYKHLPLRACILLLGCKFKSNGIAKDK